MLLIIIKDPKAGHYNPGVRAEFLHRGIGNDLLVPNLLRAETTELPATVLLPAPLTLFSPEVSSKLTFHNISSSPSYTTVRLAVSSRVDTTGVGLSLERQVLLQV